MMMLVYYFLLYPLSLLPLSVLYKISDFFAFVFGKVVKYRKQIVLINLRNSFPDKSQEELNIITDKFYTHFCDVIVETIKTFSISSEELKRRVVFKNTELVSEYYKNGKSLIAVAGHYGNWEWVALGSSLFLEHKTLGIYKPLTNKFMDEKLKKSREKLGMYMLPNHNVKAEIEGNIGKKPIIIGFVADQTPSNTTKCHWMKFLNQDTPVLLGSEKYAKEFNFPVVFGEIKKIKRGYYELIFHNISSEPLQEDEFAITEKHTRFLENIIKSQPEYWLWTHRRWKHKKPNSFQ